MWESVLLRAVKTVLCRGCSKKRPPHPPSPGAPRRAFSQARPQGVGRLRRNFLTRPTPSCSCRNSSFPVCGTSQGDTRLRTKSETFPGVFFGGCSKRLRNWAAGVANTGGVAFSPAHPRAAGTALFPGGGTLRMFARRERRSGKGAAWRARVG